MSKLYKDEKEWLKFHPPDPDFYELGTIDFSDCVLTENEILSQRGRFNSSGLGECKIEVYTNEGDIPHFHLFKLDKSFETCICIYSNNYFAHGGKYKDILNSKQCRKLDKWLKETNAAISKLTNWEYIIVAWEIANPNCNFPKYKKTEKQPDYTNLFNFKERP